MNTFNDMRNKILKLYKESFSEYPEEELKNPEDIDFLEESEDELNRKIFVIEAINEMEESEKENLICLLILYYYSYISTEDEDFQDELIDYIKCENKDDVLSLITGEERSYLYDLVSILLEEDILMYDDFEEIDDFDFYCIMEEALKNKETRKLYEIYHPNIKMEMYEYNEYLKNEKLLEKYSLIEINTLNDFIKFFSVISQDFTSSAYVNSFLVIVLDKLKNNNFNLFMEINLFMIRYYYIKNYFRNKNDFQFYRYTSFLASNEINNYNYDILNEFIDFNLVNTIYMYSLLSKSIKKEIIEMISLSNKKTYGEDGILRKYKNEDEKLILKYCILWKNIIENNLDKNDVFIYYSKDKNGDYRIPRLCLVINKKNEILDILGRDENFSLELTILDKLDFIDNYSNINRIKKYIQDLKIMKSIKNKIDNNKVLSKEEIGILYEINYKFSTNIFGHNDYRFEKLKHNKHEKKYLSSYFNCNETAVALSFHELNENTVISYGFSIYEEVCNYPNLRGVLGDLSAKNIESAEGLKSLEYIKGNGFFNSLTSSYGLSKLVRVDESLNFESLEDTSYLNKNLFAKNGIIFKDNEIPKQFRKKK